jgi:hypothetical protein
MKMTRYLIATILLVFSGHAFALFMPYDIEEITDTATSTDGGCGHNYEYDLELIKL